MFDSWMLNNLIALRASPAKVSHVKKWPVIVRKATRSFPKLIRSSGSQGPTAGPLARTSPPPPFWGDIYCPVVAPSRDLADKIDLLQTSGSHGPTPGPLTIIAPPPPP